MRVAGKGSELRVSGKEVIPPDATMLIRALRQIGYSFEQAIADLVDNSVSAGASLVLLRFFVDGERIRSIAMADNGQGMSEARLTEAMRFGSEPDIRRNSLGKFGMGMKLASLSYAKVLTVLSTRGGKTAARRWSVTGIEEGWACSEINPKSAAAIAAAPWGEIALSRRGTLVLWDEIDRLPAGSKGIRELLRQLQRRLQIHLGMTFHRFLEGVVKNQQLKIVLDLQFDGAHEHPHQVEIAALNPFAYPKSGHPDYPKTFKLRLDNNHSIKPEACIWPPNSQDECYKLGSRAASAQGFYFYRNDQLIQAGGWNGLVQNNSEPHSSLARVRVDLPEALDSLFGLNVQKSAVIVPPTFLPALSAARASDGVGFEDFRRAAQAVYRANDVRAERELPPIPGSGLPKSVRRLLSKKLHANGSGRPVDFAWANLEDGSRVFEIDRGSRRVLMNKKLRSIRRQIDSSKVQLLKTCLFFLLQDDMNNERLTAAKRQRLDSINAALAHILTL